MSVFPIEKSIFVQNFTQHFVLLYFQNFRTPLNKFTLPSKFTFPFYYEPHPLCKIAANEVQNYLQTQTDFDHNFGIDPSKKGLSIGKMFGVLVVQNQHKEIGYISAVSGKLAEKNIHKKLVPPDLVDSEMFVTNPTTDSIRSMICNKNQMPNQGQLW